MVEEEHSPYSVDKPGDNPDYDQLGYAPFAKRIAEDIHRMPPPDGLVFAIYGAWGSGKSTVLKYIESYLQRETQGEQPIVVHFNPWWFSGREDLIRNYFSQLRAIFNNKFTKDNKTTQLSDLFDQYGESIAENLPPDTHWLVKIILNVVFKYRTASDINSLKQRIEEVLRESKQKILVVVDDIDRLSADEIKQVFKLIKAVGDFPNTIYLMAFDKDVVAKALDEPSGISGEAYIEKIVQVPLELPLPDEISLSRLFFSQLNKMLNKMPPEIFDKTHWGNVYHDGIKYLLKTPRDIVRLVNVLNGSYAYVNSEVNTVDYIAIEAIRLNYPAIYYRIRSDSHQFAGSVHSYISEQQLQSFRDYHQGWINNLSERERQYVPRLLTRLFPMLDNIGKLGTTDHSNLLGVWKRERRIASPEVIDIYFRGAVREGDVSKTEFKEILSISHDHRQFGAKLIALAQETRPDGVSRVKAFLRILADYTEQIAVEDIEHIVETFLEIGDELVISTDEIPLAPFDGNEDWILRINIRMLNKLDEQKRFAILSRSIVNGHALFTIALHIAWIGSQHGKYETTEVSPEEEQVITLPHFEELQPLYLDKIRETSQDQLVDTPKLWHVLALWRHLGGDEEVNTWVSSLIATNEGLVRFLESMLRTTYKLVITNRLPTEHYRLDPKWFESYLNPSEIAERVNQILNMASLSENQTIALRQFLAEYHIRQEGKEPNHELD